MVYIGQRSAYARRQGEPNDWRTMAEWKIRHDVMQLADRLRVATSTTTVAAGTSKGGVTSFAGKPELILLKKRVFFLRFTRKKLQISGNHVVNIPT